MIALLNVKREEGVSGERKKGKKKKKRVRYLSKEEERSEKESSEWKVITQRNRKGMMIYTDYRYILKRRNCESINGKERNFDVTCCSRFSILANGAPLVSQPLSERNRERESTTFPSLRNYRKQNVVEKDGRRMEMVGGE